MKNHLILILTILFISTTAAYSQGEAAVPFLQIHPGPNLNAMAGAFTALPSSDAFGQYFNPAQLGNFSKVWTDENGNYLGTFNSKEVYSAYSIGMGIDYFIRFNMGYTLKKIHSDLGLHDVKVDAEDIGLQLTIPIIKTIDTFTEKPYLFPDGSIPFFDFSIGLAQSNNGTKVKYIDVNQLNPLPKQAKIGYAISFGLNKEYKSFYLQLLKFDWSSEARDILIKTNDYGGKDYTKFPGDIKIWDNVFLGKSDDQISIYQGWRIKLLDTFQYSQGRVKGPGYPAAQRTHGFLFSSTGLLKWLSLNFNSNILKFAVNHFELSYIGTRYTSNSPLNDTKFEAISFSIFGF